ncbi:hypothetical protein [Aeromonas hydrophila]|uniref:hypothetical protein n=1 Tax=Aeromonas hydrophila TaxID=644 RepID=UPI00398903A8
MVLALMIRVWECWRARHLGEPIEQDGVDRTINAVYGIVVRVIGRCVSGALNVVAKVTETLADLDGGSSQQGLFKLLGINLVITRLVDGLLQQCQRLLVTGCCQAIAQLAQDFLKGIGVR